MAVAAADITDEAKVIGRDGKPIGDGPYFGVGLDARTPGADALTPFRLSAGRWAAGPGEVVIDTGMAADEDRPVGSTVTITTRGEPHDFKVVGTANFGSVKSMGTATFAVFDLGAAKALFGRGDRVDGILVAGRDGVAPAQLRADLARALPQASVTTAAEQDRFTLDGLEQFISIIRIALLVFGGVAVLVGAFTIFNTLSITVAQRTRELGLLRMAGAERRQVLGSVLAEALALGVLASVVGLVAGLGLAKALDAFFDSIGLALPEAGTVFGTRTIVVSLLLGTLVTLIAGLVPAWRATRVPPVAALRAAEPGAGRVRLPARAARGARLAAGPAGAGGRRRGRRARAPQRDAPAGPHDGDRRRADDRRRAGDARHRRGRGPEGHDARRARAPARRRPTWSPARTAGRRPTRPSSARAAATGPVTGIRQDRGLAFGDKETVNSLDGDQFRFDWVEGDDGVPATLGDDGAIVDEGWAQEHGLAVGDRFTLTSAKGVELPLTVRGIEGSPLIDATGLGPVTIGKPAYDRAFENDRNLLLLTAADPARALAGLPDAQVRTKAGYVDEQVTSVDQLLAVFYVLLALAVIVSLFGIVNTLVLATFERTRELGTLRAVGMSRRQVRRMVRHESIITALLGAVTGIAAGLVLAAVVTSVFGDEGLTFVVPAGSLIGFAVVAVVAGVLAAVLPARRAARTNVLVALAYE